MIYGNETHAFVHYIGGHSGRVINLDRGPVKITCPGTRCRKKYVASGANFDAAYRAALPKPEGQRVLRLPYDLKAIAHGEPRHQEVETEADNETPRPATADRW